MMNTKAGTPMYMSPQILDDQPYSAKTDIWSLGILYYQLVYHRLPWTAKSE